MLRLLTLVVCGTRTVIDAVFGAYRVGETSYAPTLLRCLKPDMLLLADRNFAVTALVEQIASGPRQPADPVQRHPCAAPDQNTSRTGRGWHGWGR